MDRHQSAGRHECNREEAAEDRQVQGSGNGDCCMLDGSVV